MQALAMFAIGYSMTKSDIDRQGGFLVHTLVLMVLHILMLTAAVWAALLKRAPAPGGHAQGAGARMREMRDALSLAVLPLARRGPPRVLGLRGRGDSMNVGGLETELTFRRAAREDLDAVVRMLADDPLGATRETYSAPLLAAYVSAFEASTSSGRSPAPASAAATWCSSRRTRRGRRPGPSTRASASRPRTRA